MTQTMLMAFARHEPDDTYPEHTEGWKQQWFAVVTNDDREVYKCGPYNNEVEAFRAACKAVADRAVPIF